MKNLFKGICLVVALMATFAMVGCGGGGGGKSHSTAPVVNLSLNVSIPTSALGGSAGAGTNLRASVRASATFDDLLRLTVQYLDDNGTLQNAENEARKLTKNGENYKCNDISLLPGRDYRFKVFLQNAKNTILLENQISRDEVVQAAEIKVDETSTLKTRTFDTWIKENPTMSNKSFANFVANTGKTIDQLANKAVVEELSGQKADDIKTQVSALVTTVEANIDAAINKAKEEGKKEEDIVAIDLVFDVPELEKTDINKEDIADIGTEDLTKPEPAPQPEPTPDTSTITSEKLDAITDWREVDESVITELVTVDNNKAAKMLYRGTRNAQGTKWADMQANGKKRYFVEAKMPATPHHFFVFENNSVLLTISALTDGEGKTTFTYSGMTEKESIGGTVIAYTATLDNKTYIKLVDIVEVKADDAEGVAYDYYLEATDLPEDLAQEIEKQRYPDAIIKELAAKKDGWEKTDEKEDIRKYLTTGGSYSIIVNEDPLEFENITDEPDGGKAALLCYSSTDGVSWVAPIDTLVTYDAGSGSHPYSLYKDNKWDDSYEFMYDKANDIFTSNNYVYGGVITRSYKIEKTTYKDVVYYRATNTDEEQKDVYIFKMIERPNDLIKAVDAPEN